MFYTCSLTLWTSRVAEARCHHVRLWASGSRSSSSCLLCTHRKLCLHPAVGAECVSRCSRSEAAAAAQNHQLSVRRRYFLLLRPHWQSWSEPGCCCSAEQTLHSLQHSVSAFWFIFAFIWLLLRIIIIIIIIIIYYIIAQDKLLLLSLLLLTLLLWHKRRSVRMLFILKGKLFCNKK